MSTAPNDPRGPQASDGYEHRDAIPKAIGVAVVVLLLLVVGSFIAAGRIDRGFTTSAERAERDPHPMAGERRAPTAALLQANPPEHLDAWRAEQRVLESTYGWIDREAGVVRLPIERAMQLMVTRDDQEDLR